ncbi:MAG: CotH kinase family protein [Lachnospiraceae bacterium]|nr:CotH kinase family protein [Lachnospiraceae bacterium]
MQIKKEDGQKIRITSSVYKFLSSKKVHLSVILFVFLVGCLGGCLGGMFISGFFGTVDKPSPFAEEVAENTLVKIGLDPTKTQIMLSGALRENYRIPINYINGLTSNPEEITIDIKNNDFQKLAYKREVAIANGILVPSDEDFVPAKIHYNNQTVDVNLRLKGDWPDHWGGDKWSFRVKAKGNDTLLGMNQFVLQDPKTRNYLNEWLFQEAMKREGILCLRCSFVDVTINGKHKGIYALEEHFDSLLIENNNYPEGPIVRFNEEHLFSNRLLFMQAGFSEELLDYYSSTDIDVYRSGKVLDDSESFEQYIKAKDLLEAFRAGDLTVEEVFDIDKLATYVALTDVFGGQHATYWHNLRFYYNPVTSKLEPIAFDSNSGFRINELAYAADKPFLDALFEDPVFFGKYIQELERVSKEFYLDSLFYEVSDELQENLDILHKDRPYYSFSKAVFYDNQRYIQTLLNPSKGAQVYFYNSTGNRSITLEVGNMQPMPIEISNISFQESAVLEPVEKGRIIQGKMSSDPIKYEKIEFMLPENFNWSSQCILDLKLNYRFLGHSLLRNESVYMWPHMSEDFPLSDTIRKSPNTNSFDFLLFDNESKNIYITPGTWEIKEDLVIPEGYVVTCSDEYATTINLLNSSMILSYSPLNLSGNEDFPLVITSSDSTGQGIAVLNVGEESYLNRVIFSNLSAPSRSGWQLHGALTFYESPVIIENCYFLNNTAGSYMLDIIRSEFSITNSLFQDTNLNSLRGLFGKGTISGSSFINSGNSALDFSDAVVDVSECLVNGVGNAGLSAGESSYVNVMGTELKNCSAAIVSKDLSTVKIYDAKISSCNVGFLACQQKPEFGPGRIEAFSFELDNTTIPYIIEAGSSLSIDGSEITGNHKKVYEMIYGKSGTPDFSSFSEVSKHAE